MTTAKAIAAATERLTEYLERGTWSLKVREVPAGVDAQLVRRMYDKVIRSQPQVEWMAARLDSAHFEIFLSVLEQKPQWPVMVAATVARDVVGLRSLIRKTSQLQVFSSSRSLERKRARLFSADAEFVEAARRIVMVAEFEAPVLYRVAFLRVLAEDATLESLDVLMAQAQRPDVVPDLREALERTGKPEALEPLQKLL